MSERNRGVFFAVGLVVGVGLAMLFLAWAVPEFRRPAQQNATEVTLQETSGGSANDSQREEPQWRGWIRFLFKGEDTVAQWIMAFFAAAATVISYRAIVLVDRTLRANTAAVEQARIANQTAKDAVVLQTRAWLKIHVEITHNWRKEDGRLYANYQVRTENVGASPATNVRINCKVLADPPHDNSIFRAHLRQIISESVELFSLVPVLFPKEKSKPVGFSENLDATVANFPRAYICVLYRVSGSDEDRVSYKAIDAKPANREWSCVGYVPENSEFMVNLTEAMSEFIT